MGGNETMKPKFENATEFIDKFMQNKYSKMETIVSKVLEENPGTDPTDLEIHYDADTKEPIAIYKKVKVYDFKE